MNKTCTCVHSSCSFWKIFIFKSSGAHRFFASICNKSFPPKRTAAEGGSTYCVSAREALTLAQTDTNTAGRPGGAGTRVRSTDEASCLQADPVPGSWFTFCCPSLGTQCHSAMADATAPAWSQQPQHWVRVHAYPSR